MKHIQVYALSLMLVFCTSCGGQNNTSPSKENSKSETKDVSTSRESDEGKFHTKYEYIDSIGNSLIIQNSGPKGILYTDSHGKEYAKATFWTRIINETDNPLELTIDFSGDPYKFPSSVGSSVGGYFKIILPSDTMTLDKEDLFNYGLTDLDFLDNSIDKPSSLKRTINPKKSSGFYVVRLLIKPKSGWQSVKRDPNIRRNSEYGTTRAGFSLKGQNLFYTLNGKEILCGSINLNLKSLK
jgi:hypothetical protein